MDWAVVGIGLNVALKTGDFPEIADIATSVNEALECGGRSLRNAPWERFLHELDRLYMPLRREAQPSPSEVEPILAGMERTLGHPWQAR